MRKMQILVIGQTTLHWGRMEFGNIGNYYIIEPFFRELHENFPMATIKTTLQLSKEFCIRENVEVLPIEYYYGFKDNNLPNALIELSIAEYYNKYNILLLETPYIRSVLESDLIIDLSGDIWGDNADFLGKDRLLVGLIKDRVAQLLNKPTVMLAGSPGPFSDKKYIDFAKDVYKNFKLVTNREPVSKVLMKESGFDTTSTYDMACPSFLFQPKNNDEIKDILVSAGLLEQKLPKVGFILCGWNFSVGPFDRWPREDSEYDNFVQAVEFISNELGCAVYLMSHANGFAIPPNEFKLEHGRDYPIVKQLQQIISRRGLAKNIFCLDGVYDPWTTKAIIGNFDMLVSGRIHGAIAALSQAVPTVIIDYGHEPKAHKLIGFAKLLGEDKFIADPTLSDILINKIKLCWEENGEYSKRLTKKLTNIKSLAKSQFKLLRKFLVENED